MFWEIVVLFDILGNLDTARIACKFPVKRFVSTSLRIYAPCEYDPLEGSSCPMDTESRFPRILNGLTREQPPLTMSIFLTQQVSYATKVEAFNARGLSNQVSVKASDSSVYAISRAPLESRIRYENLNVELPGRIVGKPIAYTEKPGYTAILPKFDRFHFEAPTLIVEMKTGGEALHAFGMFETGTSKMGLYAGKPNSEQMRQIMTMGVDPYESVPAGNVNSSGYIAYIQAWRGINAFFYMGGGDVSKVEPLKAGIRRDSVEELNTILEEDESLTGKPKNETERSGYYNNIQAPSSTCPELHSRAARQST